MSWNPGGEHRDVFPMFGADDWPLRLASVEVTYGGFDLRREIRPQ
jgi:hypothetical protein